MDISTPQYHINQSLDNSSVQMTSLFQKTWLLWDKAWDLNISQDTRIGFLEEATAASFTYTNGDHVVGNGDLRTLAQLIEKLLQDAGNALTVKHIKWWEHHQHGALQWDMVHVETGALLVSGFSHGVYDEHGRLLSVTDFY